MDEAQENLSGPCEPSSYLRRFTKVNGNGTAAKSQSERCFADDTFTGAQSMDSDFSESHPFPTTFIKGGVNLRMFLICFGFPIGPQLIPTTELQKCIALPITVSITRSLIAILNLKLIRSGQ